MKCTVVIPIFKIHPTEEEKKSFIQCLKILHKHHVTLVCPEKFDEACYLLIAKEQNIVIGIERFMNIYFSDITGYNRLMLSTEFYKRFKKFKYILIYQLDAWVFRDELHYWCEKEYDYIGAPWFEDFDNSTSKSRIIGVGNGGFSLRNVSGILNQIKILKQLQVILKYEKYNWEGLILRMFKIIRDVTLYSKLEPFYKLTNGQEDYFWCVDMKNVYSEYINNKSFVAKLFKLFPIKNLKIADVETAIKFSMECQPARLFEMNNNNLPFGCHAWYKYNYEFWKPFIVRAGYELP